MKTAQIAISQINWERSREGSYSSKDPLLKIKDKLFAISRQEGSEEQTQPPTELDLDDIRSLKRITDNSIRKICQYEYPKRTDQEGLRQFALQPLFDLKTELAEMEALLRTKGERQDD